MNGGESRNEGNTKHTCTRTWRRRGIIHVQSAIREKSMFLSTVHLSFLASGIANGSWSRWSQGLSVTNWNQPMSVGQRGSLPWPARGYVPVLYHALEGAWV